MYKDYAVEMKGPETYKELMGAVDKLAADMECRPKQLIDKIEADII